MMWAHNHKKSSWKQAGDGLSSDLIKNSHSAFNIKVLTETKWYNFVISVSLSRLVLESGHKTSKL